MQQIRIDIFLILFLVASSLFSFSQSQFSKTGKIDSLVYLFEYELAISEITLEIEKAKREGNEASELRLLNKRAALSLRNGNWKDAQQDAFFVFNSANDRKEFTTKGDAAKTLMALNSIVGEYNIARKYLKVVRNAYLSSGDTTKQIDGLQIQGFFLREIGELDSAKIFLDSCIRLSKGRKNLLTVAKAFNNLGIVYGSQGKLKEAYQQFIKSKELLEANNFMDEIRCENLNNLTYLYFLNEQFDSVFTASAKLIELSKKMKFPITLAKAYMHRGNAYEQVGDYDSALFYNGLFHRIKDSLFSKEVTQKIALKEYKSQIEVLEIENKLTTVNLENSRNRNYVLFGLLLSFAVLIGVLIFTVNSKQKENQKLFDQIQDYLEDSKQKAEPLKSAKKIPEEVEQLILKNLKSWVDNLEFLKTDSTLDKVAKHCNTNSKYISIIITEHFKKRFPDYLNDLRISYILELLQNDEKARLFTIEALAQSAGYKSKTTFSTAFKKFTGLNPSTYVKNLNKKLS